MISSVFRVKEKERGKTGGQQSSTSMSRFSCTTFELYRSPPGEISNHSLIVSNESENLDLDLENQKKNRQPLKYALLAKISSEFLEQLVKIATQKDTFGMIPRNNHRLAISFSNQKGQIRADDKLYNFGIRDEPRHHECYSRKPGEKEFLQIGLVRKKLFFERNLREKDRKRVMDCQNQEDVRRKKHRTMLLSPDTIVRSESVSQVSNLKVQSSKISHKKDRHFNDIEIKDKNGYLFWKDIYKRNFSRYKWLYDNICEIRKVFLKLGEEWERDKDTIQQTSKADEMINLLELNEKNLYKYQEKYRHLHKELSLIKDKLKVYVAQK